MRFSEAEKESKQNRKFKFVQKCRCQAYPWQNTFQCILINTYILNKMKYNRLIVYTLDNFIINIINFKWGFNCLKQFTIVIIYILKVSAGKLLYISNKYTIAEIRNRGR